MTGIDYEAEVGLLYGIHVEIGLGWVHDLGGFAISIMVELLGYS